MRGLKMGEGGLVFFLDEVQFECLGTLVEDNWSVEI